MFSALDLHQEIEGTTLNNTIRFSGAFVSVELYVIHMIELFNYEQSLFET